MDTNGSHSSAALEREVEAQRNRVESTIGEIKDRLSPGQLVDEMLSYTKSGGGHFVANLGQTINSNPLPAALLGVSLLWLLAGPKPASNLTPTLSPSPSHGYKTIRGASLQRIGHGQRDDGYWYSEFADDGGATYRARADEKGRRMGQFLDDAGKAFGGFFDESGNRISEFRDEAGNMLDDAAGWASHTWQDVQHNVGQQADAIFDSAKNLAGDLQSQATQLSRDAFRVLEAQPLVMGALAFAAGAALGATLPHTDEEDQLLGKASDDVKRQAGGVAADLYEEGKEKAAEIYEDVSDKAAEVYGDVKGKLLPPDDVLPSIKH